MKIVLDADGVMLDYNAAYISAWKQAFGEEPKLVNPNAYWAVHRYGVPKLQKSELEYFYTFFDEEFWENVPALPGAVSACNALVSYGYEVICVSALDKKFESARLRCLQKQMFKIDKVHATGKPDFNCTYNTSPKAEIVNKIKPVAFVDDYLVYHAGIDEKVHKALITREQEGSPNNCPELQEKIPVNSKHSTLSDFALWFLSVK